MDDFELDNAIDSLEALEAREKGGTVVESGRKKQIGVVEDFFERISVAAISLTERLEVGDIIEIGDEEDAVRMRVQSMQIDREDVMSAESGDSVGIKTKHRVSSGSAVWKI